MSLTRTRAVSIATAAVLLSAGVTACGGSSGSAGSTGGSTSTSTAGGAPTSAATGTPGKKGPGGTLAFIPGATGVGFYNTLSAGAKAEAQKLGYTYLYQGAPDFTPTAQTPVVRAVCSKSPKILLIAPTDPVALRPAIQTCLSEGVKVVTVDTGLTNTQGLVSAVTSDNLQGGAAAADLVGKKLGGKGQVAVLSLNPSTTTQAQRVKGFKDELAKKYPNIKIVASEYTGQPVTASETDARAILTAHPGVTAFFGAAEPNAMGVAQVITSMGKKSSIFNVGYDADPSEVAQLKNGAIGALVIQQPALEGQKAVEFANDALTGSTSAIKKSLLLPNVVVTTSTAKDPASEKYYYSAG